MKGKVKMGFFGYILLFLAIIVGVVVVFGAILVLAPGVELLGISYTKSNSTITVNKTLDGVLLENLDIDNISIDYKEIVIEDKTFSNAHYTVSLVKDDTKNVMAIEISNNISGFSKYNDNLKYNVSYNYDATNKELKVLVQEPIINLYLSKESDIKIYFPKNYDSSNIKLKARTIEGDIILGGKMINDLSLNSLDLESKSGDISVTEEVKLTGGAIDLKTETGEITLSDQTNAFMQLHRPNINVSTKKGKVTIGELYGNVKLKTDKSTIRVGNIYGNLTIDGKSGSLFGENISGYFTATETVESTNISLKEVSGEVLLADAKDSSLTIEKTRDRVLIKGKNGNINIGQILDEAIIETEKGSITALVDTIKKVEVKSTSGKIDINIKSSTLGHTIQSDSGDIKVNLNVGLNVKVNLSTTKEIKTPWETLTNGNKTVCRGTATEAELINIINIKSNNGNINLTENAVVENN